MHDGYNRSIYIRDRLPEYVYSDLQMQGTEYTEVSDDNYMTFIKDVPYRSYVLFHVDKKSEDFIRFIKEYIDCQYVRDNNVGIVCLVRDETYADSEFFSMFDTVVFPVDLANLGLKSVNLITGNREMYDTICEKAVRYRMFINRVKDVRYMRFDGGSLIVDCGTCTSTVYLDFDINSCTPQSHGMFYGFDNIDYCTEEQFAGMCGMMDICRDNDAVMVCYSESGNIPEWVRRKFDITIGGK